MLQVQTRASKTTDSSNEILCLHVNTTSQIQIIRIVNIPNLEFERVVFPGQRLSFLAVSEALLEVYISQQNKIILMEKIPCTTISVNEETSVLASLKLQMERQLMAD